MPEHLIDWSEMPELAAGPGVWKQTLDGDDVALTRVRIQAGVKAPKHSHPHEQFVQVLEGSGVLETEAGRSVFKAGSVFHFRPGAWHAAEFTGDTILVETNLR